MCRADERGRLGLHVSIVVILLYQVHEYGRWQRGGGLRGPAQKCSPPAVHLQCPILACCHSARSGAGMVTHADRRCGTKWHVLANCQHVEDARPWRGGWRCWGALVSCQLLLIAVVARVASLVHCGFWRPVVSFAHSLCLCNRCDASKLPPSPAHFWTLSCL